MRDDADKLFYLGVGPLAAIVLGAGLIPFRELTTASNLTLVFLVLTIIVGHLGGRWPAVATALTAALSLDFFLTRPYMRLSIESKQDLIAFGGLAVCGLVAAALGTRRGPTRQLRRQWAVLEEALRHLERRGPGLERLNSILQGVVTAFPVAALAVRNARGEVVASCGPASVRESAPTLEGWPDDLAGSERGWPKSGDELPATGMRLLLSDEGRSLGSLEVWGGRGPMSREGLALLAGVARVVGAIFAQRERSSAPLGQREDEQPAAAWARPERRRPD